MIILNQKIQVKTFQGVEVGVKRSLWNLFFELFTAQFVDQNNILQPHWNNH